MSRYRWMDVVADAVDCESRGTSVRELREVDRGLGVARGWLSGSGRQVDRQRRGGEGRSAAGWLLSVDGYCRCIDLSTGGGKEEGRGGRGLRSTALYHDRSRLCPRCSGNESRSYPHPFVPSYVHLHRTRSARTVNARHYLPAKTRIRTSDNVSLSEEFAIDVAVFRSAKS